MDNDWKSIADVRVQTADLWSWKQPLYQLRHNRGQHQPQKHQLQLSSALKWNNITAAFEQIHDSFSAVPKEEVNAKDLARMWNMFPITIHILPKDFCGKFTFI